MSHFDISLWWSPIFVSCLLIIITVHSPRHKAQSFSGFGFRPRGFVRLQTLELLVGGLKVLTFDRALQKFCKTKKVPGACFTVSSVYLCLFLSPLIHLISDVSSRWMESFHFKNERDLERLRLCEQTCNFRPAVCSRPCPCRFEPSYDSGFIYFKRLCLYCQGEQRKGDEKQLDNELIEGQKSRASLEPGMSSGNELFYFMFKFIVGQSACARICKVKG